MPSPPSFPPKPRPRLLPPFLFFSLLLSLLLLLLPLPQTLASLTRETGPSQQVPTSVFYDAFSTRIYDPHGRVLQLEYALQATKKGGAAVGAVSQDMCVLASWTPRMSKRQAPAREQAALGLWRGDAHVAMAASGMATDALALVEVARRECLSHRYIYDSPLNVGRLVGRLGQEVYDTERHRIVPYALDLLVCGYDESTGNGGGPCLYNVGPAGIYESFRAYAVGRQAEEARNYLKEHLEELEGGKKEGKGVGLKRLTTLVLEALVKTTLVGEEGGKEGGERRRRRRREADDKEEEDGERLVEEDISLVVIGKGLPYTPLTVRWDPRKKRMEVKIPATLKALL